MNQSLTDLKSALLALETPGQAADIMAKKSAGVKGQINTTMPHHAGQQPVDTSDHFAPPPQEHGGLLHKLLHSGSDMAAAYGRGHAQAAADYHKGGKVSTGGQPPKDEAHQHAWHAGYHMHNMLAGAGVEK